MYKRICLVCRRKQLSCADFHARWPAALARDACRPPADVRPVRAVACHTLHRVAGCDLPHDGISTEWFEDTDALRRYEAWLRSAAPSCAADVIEPASTPPILAQEVVMRGADWLERRWAGGAPKLKHMALARPAEGLGSADFSARWRARPGRIGGAGSQPVIAIPEPAKGRAYVQNHPLTGLTTPWTYDAINEVYFDDLESMRARLDFFRDHDVSAIDADLVSATRFAVVCEHVIPRCHARA